jgi:hypothetical protein
MTSRIDGYRHSDDSWWAVRSGRWEPTVQVVSVEVHMQSKLFAIHAEADTKSELIARVKAGLAELEGLGAAPAAEKPAKKKEEAPAPAAEKPAKPAKGAAKITLDAVKRALTKLRAAVGGDDDPEKAGIKAVKKVLKAFGVAQSPDLREERYADVMAAIEAAMPAADEDADEEGEGY